MLSPEQNQSFIFGSNPIPQNRTNLSIQRLFPSINKNKSSDENHKVNFQLNNQGCKCQLCQKIILNQNMKIIKGEVSDLESEQFNKDKVKQHYLHLIGQICQKWKWKRGLRFNLPEICQYENGHPVALIQKKKQNSPISIDKSKSRLHFFQIQSFFLNGFISHSPTKKARTSKKQATNKAYINECIVFGKYQNNCYRMLTHDQIQSMFRSKNKSMKDGLMYLQTVAGGDYFNCVTVIVKLDQIDFSQQIKALWEKAKTQVNIVTGEVKLTDVEFYGQNQQILFENQLKDFDMNRYLLYLSYKIILISSRVNEQIIKDSIFKFAVVEKKVYLFDVRVVGLGSRAKYCSSNMLQALQIKIEKTMNLMQLDNPQKEEKQIIFENQLGSKARQLSDWLKSSTLQEWQQMRVIRNRLQKLQQQKKSLLKSKNQQMIRRGFKVRSIRTKKNNQKNQNKTNLSCYI